MRFDRMLGYQGLCQTCAYTLASASTTTGGKISAAVMFCLWPLGFLAHATRLIRAKVVHERRAIVVVRRAKGGAHAQVARWIDAYPAVMTMKQRHAHARGVDNYTGPSNFCGTPKALHCAGVSLSLSALRPMTGFVDEHGYLFEARTR